MNLIYMTRNLLIVMLIFFNIYPQCTSFAKDMIDENSIKVEEKVITNNLDYLKESIIMPQFISNKKNDEKILLINKKVENDILSKSNEAEEVSKQYFSSLKDNNLNFPYEIKSNYYLTSDNKDVISIYNDYYEYLGGAHGNTIRTSYTVDKSNEKLLTLKDLFLAGYEYKNLINEKVKEQIKTNKDEYFFADPDKDFKGIGDQQDFYLEDKNLVIYYQLYEIAPYVKGIPEFRIQLEVFGKNYIYNK